MLKRIFILIISSYFVINSQNLLALPVYQSYNNTNIFTTKFKLGFYNGSSKVEDYNFTSNEKGLSLALEINPLYNLKILHNLYMGLNASLATGGDLRNNNLALTLSYNLPLTTSLVIVPDWFPLINIFAGGGYGIRQTRVAKSSEFTAAKINKNNNVTVLALGLEVTPKQLQDYNLRVYLEAKSLISEYTTVEYGEKKSRQFTNSFVTIGLVYKIDYLIK